METTRVNKFLKYFHNLYWKIFLKVIFLALLIYRARYLALLVCGENHPHVALLDSNIGLILHAVAEYELSLKFLEKALDLSKKYFGARSLKTAVGHHLVARTQSCIGTKLLAINVKKSWLLKNFYFPCRRLPLRPDERARDIFHLPGTTGRKAWKDFGGFRLFAASDTTGRRVAEKSTSANILCEFWSYFY